MIYRMYFIFVIVPVKIIRRAWMLIERHFFRRCGKNVIIGHGGSFAYENIELGNHIYIGPNALFMASNSRIFIGNKVVIGPQVKIIGGDHRTNIIGEYIIDVTIKSTENDVDVDIGEDVWIGAGAIILKGVKIGRGSVIGAGTVLTRSIPSYSVVVGNPGRDVRKRFTENEIELHEQLLERHR